MCALCEVDFAAFRGKHLRWELGVGRWALGVCAVVSDRAQMVVILMGPAGAGKSTIGRALAGRLRWSFVDADDLHSPASIARMAEGIALDDAGRASWLDRVNLAMRTAAANGSDLVVACSALRERYPHVELHLVGESPSLGRREGLSPIDARGFLPLVVLGRTTHRQ